MEQRLVPQSEGELNAQLKFANSLLVTGFLPTTIKTPQQALAIIVTGQELGIGPMEALRSINIIQGKPTMSAQLMLGLAYQRVKGFKCNVTVSNDKECRATFGRSGQSDYEQSFTIQDAAKMGLTGKDNWNKQAATMLRWRCISAGLRVVAPDAIAGLYTPEELNPDLKVDFETGEVVHEEAKNTVVIKKEPVQQQATLTQLPPSLSQANPPLPSHNTLTDALDVFGPETVVLEEDVKALDSKQVLAPEPPVSHDTGRKPRAPQKKPHVRYSRDQIDVIDSWAIKEELKRLGFRYNVESKAWSAPSSDDLLRSVCELTGENPEDFMNP